MDGIVDEVMQQFYKINAVKTVAFSEVDLHRTPAVLLTYVGDEKGSLCDVSRFKGVAHCGSMPELLEVMQGIKERCHNKVESKCGCRFEYVLRDLHTVETDRLVIKFNLEVRSYVG